MKVVGLGKDRDYNSVIMCCRISTTGFAARTIAGLYILLATFLVGFFAVASIPWLRQMKLSESGIEPASPQSQPCVEEDRLSLYLPHPLEYESEGQQPYFEIVNDDVNPVFIFVDEDGQLVDRPLMVDEVAKSLNFHQIELKPRETAWFKVSSSPLSEFDGRSLVVTFNYSKSVVRHSHIVSAVFGDGRRSIPDRCYYK